MNLFGCIFNSYSYFLFRIWTWTILMPVYAIFFPKGIAIALNWVLHFSGFGLGTILMPVYAIFFPIGIAIALNWVLHFSNNIFKISLIGKKADKKVLLRFGIPAIIASFAGAFIGNKFLKKITLRFIQVLFANLLFLIAIVLGAGLI